MAILQVDISVENIKLTETNFMPRHNNTILIHGTLDVRCVIYYFFLQNKSDYDFIKL